MPLSQKIAVLFKYYAQLWGLYILFGILLGILTVVIPELKTDAYSQEFLRVMLKEHPFKLFVFAVIYAPIVEEMMFRTCIRPSHKELMLFTAAWPVFFINRWIPADVHWMIQLVFIAVLLMVLSIILIALIPETKTARLRAFGKRYSMLFLIGSSLLFGLVHITNYVDEFTITLPLFLLIVPRILSGMMMGLIKIKNNGLIWSMGLHALNNGFVVIVLFLIEGV